MVADRATPIYSTTMFVEGNPYLTRKRLFFGRKSDAGPENTKSSVRLHLELQKPVDLAKRAFKKAVALTPGHEKRVTRRNNMRSSLIEKAVLRSTLRDEKGKTRAAKKVAEELNMELEDEKQENLALQIDIRNEKCHAFEQDEKLQELDIEKKVSDLRLELETKSFAAAKAQDAQEITILKHDANKLKSMIEQQLAFNKIELTNLQRELVTLQQQLECAGTKLKDTQTAAAEEIEALELDLKQVEIYAEEHLASEKDRLERENSNLAWGFNQMKKQFENEREHVNAMLDEYHFLEAENKNVEAEKDRLRTQHDALREKVQSMVGELNGNKKEISTAISKMYLEYPMAKKDSETTCLTKALGDYIDLGKKKLQAVMIRAEKSEGQLAEVTQTANATKLKNEELEIELAEARKCVKAAAQKSEQMEAELTDAKKLAQSTTCTDKGSDSLVEDATAQATKLKKRCVELEKQIKTMQDDMETEECITTDKMQNLQAELDYNHNALTQADTYNQQLRQENLRMTAKVQDSIRRCDREIGMATKRQKQAEAAYDVVVESECQLRDEMDNKQKGFDAHLAKVKQDHDDKMKELRTALNDAEWGRDTGGTVSKAIDDLGEILGASKEVQEASSDNTVHKDRESNEKKMDALHFALNLVEDGRDGGDMGDVEKLVIEVSGDEEDGRDGSNMGDVEKLVIEVSGDEEDGEDETVLEGSEQKAFD